MFNNDICNPLFREIRGIFCAYSILNVNVVIKHMNIKSSRKEMGRGGVTPPAHFTTALVAKCSVFRCLMMTSVTPSLEKIRGIFCADSILNVNVVIKHMNIKKL
jgi:hypothetical protein